MGVINASPESFHPGSVKSTPRAAAAAAMAMEEEGADIIDVGGMSTAPYLGTMVSEGIELKRVDSTVRAVRGATDLPISVDTCRASVARRAMELGAEIINDVTGLNHDPDMAGVIDRYAPSLILCAYANKARTGSITETRDILQNSIRLARAAGADPGGIAVDPAIGFFRPSGRGRLFSRTKADWAVRDLCILRDLGQLGRRHPVVVSVSAKSFIGEVLGIGDPRDRMPGSLACEVLAVINGADVIRTHNVQETRRAVGAAAMAPHKAYNTSNGLF
ncbi:dihydropteroate synthase [Cenarchaeum symbiosum A]|uniref:dihydropteroate synthase n=1 Tax=Cenarchaeum symbiosum (strain A) TaxID=414004 RepID=A0RZ44_CENSY|nr:dihydropteroate synthase [Cenarchaeum symbiosum A]